MLKKLETTGHQTAVSKSAIKQMRMSIINQSSFSQQQISVFWSKKAKVMSYKMKAVDDKKCEHVVVDKQNHFVFIQEKTFPTLKLIHSYPDMYPRFTVDPGALKFVLKGANIMCPGLTNQNAKMDQVQQKSIVSIYAKDLQHAIGIGITTMSTEQIRKVNEGIAVELVHYIGDSFWSLLYAPKQHQKQQQKQHHKEK